MPVRSERPSVKASTRRSSCGSRALISLPPHSVTSKSPSLIQSANRTPSAPPTVASKTLSVNNCRTKRQRLAPKASRTAISFFRDDATNEQQIRNVCASDQQHQSNDSQQQVQRRREAIARIHFTLAAGNDSQARQVLWIDVAECTFRSRLSHGAMLEY